MFAFADRPDTELALAYPIVPPLFSASPSFIGIWADNYGAALWPISFQLCPPGEMSPNSWERLFKSVPRRLRGTKRKPAFIIQKINI